MAVFVLDKQKTPLMPCSEKRARQLLTKRRAVVHRHCPFTIRLKDRVGGETQAVQIKIDPGSKVTGIAIVRTSPSAQHALVLAELTHRGRQISESLTQRGGMRRRRRSANLRYREPRFLNRTKPAGWLVPSLQHRVDTTLAWVKRFRRLAPVTSIAVERVRFDMQAMQHPEISGAEYQQGTLFGYEMREYLLEKWQRKCAYCEVKNVPLQIEHIVAKSKGGSNRASNLTLACEACNISKGARDVKDFLAQKPHVLKRIQAHAKAPLRDAAAVNATRNRLFNTLLSMGLPVEAASGGRTKWNRQRLSIPKAHCLDALCVGVVDAVMGWQRPVLHIKAMGRGSYQRTRLTKFGFPRGYLMRKKQAFRFQTGDQIIATVPSGKYAGVYAGRVAIRASGSFNIQVASGVIQGISYRHCRLIQRADGYGYVIHPTTTKESGNTVALRAALSLPGMNARVSRAI